jgi:hypothetical protein
MYMPQGKVRRQFHANNGKDEICFRNNCNAILFNIIGAAALRGPWPSPMGWFVNPGTTSSNPEGSKFFCQGFLP